MLKIYSDISYFGLNGTSLILDTYCLFYKNCYKTIYTIILIVYLILYRIFFYIKINITQIIYK
jgi:hypothetical protein